MQIITIPASAVDHHGPLPYEGISSHATHEEERCHGSGIRGWTGELWEFRDEFFLYKKRDKGEAMVDDVRVVEEGAGDYGARGRYDPPKLWISQFSFVFLLFVSGQGRRSTRARGG